MLDINLIETEFDRVVKALNNRNQDYSEQLKKAIEKNQLRKNILGEVEKLKAEKNQLSKQIGELIVQKRLTEVEVIKKNVSEMNNQIDSLDEKLRTVVTELSDTLAYIPNLPQEDVVIGKDENDNKEIRRWNDEGKKEQKIPHWEIAAKLDLVDFELGPKLSGSRFVVYTGIGAKLVRAVADILLSRHVKHGYKEFNLPVIVNPETMYGTGQLPKFKDDAYTVGDDQFLSPTAEVQLTNIHANEILNLKDLPLKYTAYTQCFRQESGSAGRDTKGLIRLHQFNKVEMVKIVEPKNSNAELESLVEDAEAILQLFNLPYRVVELSTGDLGFSAQKTYDLEVWFPSQKTYREISSCSNCGDFQARNMKIRYKDENNKTQLVHTLNGSGVAIDRLIAALLENYWDGKNLNLPDIFKPYFGK